MTYSMIKPSKTGQTDQEMKGELIMITINGTAKFDKQMKRFKKHSKIVKTNTPDSSYYGIDNTKKFPFLDLTEYNPCVFGKSGNFFTQILLKNFFNKNTPKAIYYIEAWKQLDEDGEFYIELKELKNDGATGVFEVWNYYDVATMELTFIANPNGLYPKLVKLTSLDSWTHYTDDDTE